MPQSVLPSTYISNFLGRSYLKDHNTALQHGKTRYLLAPWHTMSIEDPTTQQQELQENFPVLYGQPNAIPL